MISHKRLAGLRAVRAKGVGRMLLLARRDFLARVQDKIAARGGAHMPASWAGLLPYIDVDGTRSTVLAQRAGISKQAVGKVVRELEELGLLTRSADAADGRAFLVTFTPRGLERLLQTHEAISEVEAEYEALVGPEAMAVLRRALHLIAYSRGERPTA